MIPPRFYSTAIASLLITLTQAYWLPETLPASSFKTCTVPGRTKVEDGSLALKIAIQACGNTSRIIFSANESYTLLTPVYLTGLENVEFVINGNVSLSSNVTYMESITANSTLYTGYWFKISKSTGVTLTGSQNPALGWFVGHGEKWWPRANNDLNTLRPHWFRFDMKGLRTRHLKIYNTPAHLFSVGGKDTYMTDTLLDARSDDNVNAFPFNTDGVDLTTVADVVIDGWTSWNGDDVINVTPPARNVTMRNIVAYGTHGISVSCKSASNGTAPVGGDYLFENAVVYDSLIGARFKGSVGQSCHVSNVTWRNITTVNTSYPVHFIQNYVNQAKGVAAGLDSSLAGFASNFTWDNIVARTGDELRDGTCISDPCWQYTPGESTQKALYIMCVDPAHCKNFRFNDVSLYGADGKAGEMKCTGLEGVKGMGIPCTNGTLPA